MCAAFSAFILDSWRKVDDRIDGGLDYAVSLLETKRALKLCEDGSALKMFLEKGKVHVSNGWSAEAWRKTTSYQEPM